MHFRVFDVFSCCFLLPASSFPPPIQFATSLQFDELSRLSRGPSPSFHLSRISTIQASAPRKRTCPKLSHNTMSPIKKRNRSPLHVIPNYEHAELCLKRRKPSNQDLAFALLSPLSSISSIRVGTMDNKQPSIPQVVLVEYIENELPSIQDQGAAVSDDEGDQEPFCLSRLKPLPMKPQIFPLTKTEVQSDAFLSRPLPSPPRLPNVPAGCTIG